MIDMATCGLTDIVFSHRDTDGTDRHFHITRLMQRVARPIVDQSANIVTDAHLSYEGLAEHFHSHHVVDHSQTFVRGIIFHTNFAESYHSLLKRGIIGAFHHVSDKHLPRYLAEFDRRWNTRKERDGARTVNVINTAFAKRLTYKMTVGN